MPRFDVFHNTQLCGLQYIATVDSPTELGARQRVAYEQSYLISQLTALPASQHRKNVVEAPRPRPAQTMSDEEAASLNTFYSGIDN